MAVSVEYNKIWKWIAVDWVTMQTFYWEDFNPTPFVRPSSWSTASVTNATTSFDLSGFQPWHEVGCWVIMIKATEDLSGTLYWDFERYRSGWSTARYHSWYIDLTGWGEGAYYIYFWVDDDEVWTWYTKYRVHYYTMNGKVDSYSPEFTMSNLSIDDDTYSSWYMRVEWAHLCYVDGTYNSTWYKHTIAYDNSYSSYVWSDKAGYIWLDSSDNSRIYYVDKAWTKRRTYNSSTRYWGNVNVWSSNKWFIRVSNWWGMEDWYWHLCFVTQSGYKRRILNWPPRWYS